MQKNAVVYKCSIGECPVNPIFFHSSFEKLLCFDEACLRCWQHNKPFSAASYHQTSTKGLASSIPSEQFVFMWHCSRSTHLNVSCRWFDFNHLAEVKITDIGARTCDKKSLFPDNHRHWVPLGCARPFICLYITLFCWSWLKHQYSGSWELTGGWTQDQAGVKGDFSKALRTSVQWPSLFALSLAEAFEFRTIVNALTGNLLFCFFYIFLK